MLTRTAMPANDRGGREVNDDPKIALDDPVVLRDQVVPWPFGLTSSPRSPCWVPATPTPADQRKRRSSGATVSRASAARRMARAPHRPSPGTATKLILVAAGRYCAESGGSPTREITAAWNFPMGE